MEGGRRGRTMREASSEPPRGAPFTVMAKPAGPACNLACEYCFYREKSALYPGMPTRMSAETLETFTRQYLESQPRGELTFAWQGGEPTLLGLEFFRAAVELQRRYADGRRVRNALQTNGVLIDGQWAEFLAANDFLVGVSIDGPPELHDRFRRDPAGRPTSERVVEAIGVMKRAGVEFNTLTVVNRRTSRQPLEVYEFLKGIGSTFLQFIPVVERVARRTPGAATERPALAGPPGTEGAEGAVLAPWSVEPADYRDFLCAIFDRWVREDVGGVFVQHFEAMLSAVAGRRPGLCVFDERCGTALVVEHNGDVYSCDHYVYPAFRLGSIFETPLAVFARSEAQTAFGNAKHEALPGQCRACPFRFACNGGCPKHRFVRTRDGASNLNYLCPAYRGFLEHAGPALRAIVHLLADGRPAALIMDRLRADDLRRRFATAGRNDPCPCGSGRKFKHCCGAGGAAGTKID
jgi:uncharacterized protein